jgi:hypothetical protein
MGKTAFYDPAKMSVTLYINGRHPKDIMRSLSHELIHHTQNCNGQFDNVGEMGEGYAQNDEHLREMERQAYEEGNLCFRDWEDSIKGTIYNESLQKGAKKKMSLKDWKNNELKTLLSEKWGFSFNLLTESQEEAADDETLNEEEEEELEERRAKGRDREGMEPDSRRRPMEENEQAFAPNHYCVHHGGVERNGSVELAEAVAHNYNKKLGRVTHYDMKFADGTIVENVAFEDIQVTDASLEEAHGSHPAKRDKDKDLDEAEKKGKYDDGDGKDEKCDHVPCKGQDKKEKMNEQKVRRIIRKLVKEAMTKKAK